MRLNQPHDRMPPLRVPILTKMVVSASVASVLYALLLETTSEQQRAAAVHHSHVHRVHHVRGGAAAMPTAVGLTSMQLPPVAT